jgi:hypothetical protein
MNRSAGLRPGANRSSPANTPGLETGAPTVRFRGRVGVRASVETIAAFSRDRLWFGLIRGAESARTSSSRSNTRPATSSRRGRLIRDYSIGIQRKGAKTPRRKVHTAKPEPARLAACASPKGDAQGRQRSLSKPLRLCAFASLR